MENIKISVIGLGYVGLPLAIELSGNFEVTGFDINKDKIISYLDGIDVTNEIMDFENLSSKVLFTYDEANLSNSNVYIITVPTPINFDKTPDLTPLINATKLVGKYLRKGDVVIYESTVYPGTTEEICVPILEKESKLNYNKEFAVGYSPERINPGDKTKNLKNIAKIISASNDSALEKIKYIYGSIINEKLHTASSIKIAEAAKVIENSQRDINIAFMNELSKVFNLMGISTSEVLKAAKTKWNFLDFKPGLVGGHCIGVDPYYFIYKAEQLGYRSQIISASRKVNEDMVEYLVNQILKLAIEAKLDTRHIKVSILGVTFKPNCNDLRNSKVLELVEALREYDWEIVVYDPVVEIKEYLHKNKLNQSDIVILAVPHDILLQEFDISLIDSLYKNNPKKIFIDINNVHYTLFQDKENYIYWGL